MSALRATAGDAVRRHRRRGAEFAGTHTSAPGRTRRGGFIHSAGHGRLVGARRRAPCDAVPIFHGRTTGVM